MKVERRTNETEVTVELARGTGHSSIKTSVPFLDHMMITLARYSGLEVTLAATGDLKHHLIEDTAITLGAALVEMIPPACARYGDRTVAMDDAVVQVVLDAGGRPFYRGPLPATLYDHWMRSFADNARMTLHVIVIRGRNRHHIVEAAFKALGLALHDALRESGEIFSTKGTVTVRKS